MTVWLLAVWLFWPRPAWAQAGPGACRVESFTMTLEGWSGERQVPSSGPCRLAPIAPQATCKTAPCYNLACRAVIHYHAVFELPPGATRPWPSCNFRQERIGRRTHDEDGRAKTDQLEPAGVVDTEGAIASWGAGYRLAPVDGRPDVWALDFYDLPGWASRYPLGQPSATAPRYFPLTFRYMYRAYFGPKRAGIEDNEYRYARVDLVAAVAPAPSFGLEQGERGPDDWHEYSRLLFATMKR